MKPNGLRIYLLSLQSRKSMFGNYYKSKQGRVAAASLPFFISTRSPSTFLSFNLAKGYCNFELRNSKPTVCRNILKHWITGKRTS